MSYGRGAAISDEYYQENLVMGDLPRATTRSGFPSKAPLTIWMCISPREWSLIFVSMAVMASEAGLSIHPSPRVYPASPPIFSDPLTVRTFVLNYAHPLRQTTEEFDL